MIAERATHWSWPLNFFWKYQTFWICVGWLLMRTPSSCGELMLYYWLERSFAAWHHRYLLLVYPRYIKSLVAPSLGSAHPINLCMIPRDLVRWLLILYDCHHEVVLGARVPGNLLNLNWLLFARFQNTSFTRGLTRCWRYGLGFCGFG